MSTVPPDRLQECCAYLDQHFYMSYDSSKQIEQLLPVFSSDSYLSRLQKMISFDNVKVDSLLLGQKRLFEILLALSRLDNKMTTPILVLDEYLDKDLRVTLTQVKSTLDKICSEIDAQVFIVTHAKSVVDIFHDDIIALNRGKIYSRQGGGIGKPLNNLPHQLDFI
jgi:ABC-type uncharacterized transport system ATPase subunit